MSGFRVTANTAGIESSANTMSVVSMTTSATSSGVAMSRPPSRRQKSCPCNTGLTRTTRAIQVPHTSQASLTTFRSRSAPNSSRQAANRMRVAKWIADPLNAFDEREPGANRQRPEHERACDAEQQHATLILGGNVKLREDDDEDEDVVDRQRLLEQVRREIFRRGASTVSCRDPQPYRKP